jgi:phenylalanyl-tRNA synthetase beta chain
MWKKAPEALQADFWWAKGLAEAALAALGLTGLEAVADPEAAGLHPGRAARLEYEGRTLAVFGEVHPLVAEGFDLPQAVRTAAIVLHPEAIEAALAHRGPRVYRPISRFPAIVRDLAIVVDDTLPAGQLLGQARTAGEPLLEEAAVFDRYQGPQVPAGKVSLALSLRYRSQERTLTDTEVEVVHQTVVERLREQFGAALR